MSDRVAEFRFYEELNDFLTSANRKTSFTYSFNGSPSIKDAIEAIGVPHTEVDLIVVNGCSVGFDYRLCSGDRVAVYPTFESVDVSPVTQLRARPLRKTAFVADTHLRKLARLLRMLGFDTLYCSDYDDAEVVNISIAEQRIILTRGRAILKNRTVTHGYWLRSTDPKEQLCEVLDRFDLYMQIKPFDRCILCNGLIDDVDLGDVRDRLPPRTAREFDKFCRCTGCAKIYWQGSHYDRMKDFIDTLRRERRAR
jgi:uncharacterized protein with PIN domain